QIEALLLEDKGLPFHITLLHEAGYLEYVKKEYCESKGCKQHKLIAEIFEAAERQVRGNINVLVNPRTKENKKTYTAHIHVKEVRLLIKGLLKGTIVPDAP